MSKRLRRAFLALVLIIYLALAVGYGIAAPLFEAPDEHLHYFTAEFIAREGRLPTTMEAGRMGQESAQPPLYYALASLLVRAVDGSGAASGELWRNPQADPQDPRGESLAVPPININMFIHGPEEAWPWRGRALAAHLIRMMSAVMGLGTLLCIYAAGRAVWPLAPGRALLATALVAFLPQFAFIHGVVSNDPAITLFSAAALWQLLRLTTPVVQRGAKCRVTSDECRVESAFHSSLVTRHSSLVTLGFTIGLAMLSKAAGLLLLVYCGGVVAVAVWRGAEERRVARAAGAVALLVVPALVVGGWLFVRNWLLYGDPTAANQFVAFAGGLRPYTLAQVWHDMDRVWHSLFAFFGWMNLRPPAWVWAVWNVIALAALAGVAVQLVAFARRRPRARPAPLDLLLHPAVILSGWFLLVALAWLQFKLRTPADQGRLFFPALVPLALGAVYGLSRWPRPWTQLVVAGAALVTSLYCVAVVIPTAYARPPIVSAVPQEADALTIAFPEGLEVLATRMDTPVVGPGEWAWATIYWRRGAEIADGAPPAHLEAFGRDFHRIGRLIGYHGRGNYPATLWPAGAIIADRMAVRVDEDALAPVEANLTIKLDEDGEGIDIGTVKVIPAAWPEMAEPLATWGESVQLAAAELSATTAAPGETIEVRLRWQVIAPPGPGLRHVFVHLGDPTRPPLAQTDRPVMADQYPMRLWAAGEVFEETVSLVLPDDLPPGNYPINVGLYEFDSGARLPLVVGGERRANDVFTVDPLLVVRRR